VEGCWCCESREYIIQKPTSEKITNIKKVKNQVPIKEFNLKIIMYLKIKHISN
jgi:hypothetical protein